MSIPNYRPLTASSSQSLFETITGNLQSLSKTINMTDLTPLGERDVNTVNTPKPQQGDKGSVKTKVCSDAFIESSVYSSRVLT